MKAKGIIFDFNGTMFWDSEYQISAWDKYLAKNKLQMTASEKEEYIHGRNCRDTFEFLFKRTISDNELDYLIEQKEIIYRNECMKHKMILAPGLESLLIFLKDNDIKIAIATAAGKKNVEFFIEKFNLLNFFERKNIIYDDGKIKGKPHPDLFNKAAESLNICKNEIIIFEDSKSGIEAARKSGAGKIIVVNSARVNFKTEDLETINDFNQFDRNLVI
ncbi:MAG: HAD family phosphatase [Spirochaetales bacterium]|nr:HAD family phosphatase [Spirochaetales bacterium]